MYISISELKKELAKCGIKALQATIETAYNAIDEDATFEKHRAKFVPEVWDQVSPINGAPADKVKQQHPIPPNGEVYLLKNPDGGVMVLQTTHPETQTMMPVGTGLAVANKHADMLAAMAAKQEIFTRVQDKVLEGDDYEIYAATQIA